MNSHLVALGQMLGDQLHGFGRLRVARGPRKGDIFEGHFENNVRCGHGTYTWENGDKLLFVLTHQSSNLNKIMWHFK